MEIIRQLIYNFGALLFFLGVFTLLFYLGFKSKKPLWKQISFNSSAIFFALFIFEFYSVLTVKTTINSNAVFSGSFAHNKTVSGKKKLVGYGPIEDSSFQVTSIRKNNDSTIYNVTYSFANGRRVVPNNNDTSNNNLFIVGCSHAFGDGLNDNQTLPYFINKHANQKYHIYNHAFSSYGTHQALKIVENKILSHANLSNAENNCVIYSFIPSHFERAAGYKIWNVHDPYYEVENNQLIYKGSFDENRLFKSNFLVKGTKKVWRSSQLYKSLFTPTVNQNDIIRVVQLIKQMSLLLSKKNIRFIVLLSQSDLEYDDEHILYEELKTYNIEHYFATSIIKDLEKNTEKYIIIGDGHPNEKYNDKIAAYLIQVLNELNN